MKVNIKPDHTTLRLNNMRPGTLFHFKGSLYIRTGLTTDYHINCVNVVSGELIVISKNEVCQVRNDLHITNIEAKDED